MNGFEFCLPHGLNVTANWMEFFREKSEIEEKQRREENSRRLQIDVDIFGNGWEKVKMVSIRDVLIRKENK